MKQNEIKAIVTGGASGLGRAVVDKILQSGGKVAVVDLSKNVPDDFEKLGVVYCSADITDEEAVKTAVAEVKAKFGSVNALVNCAGIGFAKRVLGKNGMHPLDDFKKVLNINLVGTFNMIRIVADEMTHSPEAEDGERGAIVNTASFAAYEGQVGQAAYSAAKGGIVSMTLPIAREFARFGIRVNTVAPGIMNTPMSANLPKEAVDSMLQSAIFPVRLGKPDEFASIVMELITNGYLNGTVVRLDGAMRLPPR